MIIFRKLFFIEHHIHNIMSSIQFFCLIGEHEKEGFRILYACDAWNWNHHIGHWYILNEDNEIKIRISFKNKKPRIMIPFWIFGE